MGKIAGTVATGLSAAIGVFWLIALLVPTGWQQKSIVGFTYYFGLWKVEATGGLGSLVLSAIPTFGFEGVAKFKTGLEKLATGKSDLGSMKLSWCSGPLNLAPAGCDAMTSLHAGSWTMGIMGFLGVVFFFLGAGFSYYYWQNEAREEPRMWARVSFIIAPSSTLLGLLIYTFFQMGLAGWSVTPFDKSSNTCGTAFMFAWVLAVLSFIPLVLHEVFAGKAWIEDHNEATAEYRHDQRQAAMDSAYGGNGYNSYGTTAPMGAPMGGPPMQQQDNWGMQQQQQQGYGYQGN